MEKTKTKIDTRFNCMGGIDTWFQYPIVRQKITHNGRTSVTYAVLFQGVNLPLQIKPQKGQYQVEISARELLLCFSRHFPD